MRINIVVILYTEINIKNLTHTIRKGRDTPSLSVVYSCAHSCKIIQVLVHIISKSSAFCFPTYFLYPFAYVIKLFDMMSCIELGIIEPCIITYLYSVSALPCEVYALKWHRQDHISSAIMDTYPLLSSHHVNTYLKLQCAHILRAVLFEHHTRKQ